MRKWYLEHDSIDPWPEISGIPWISWIAPTDTGYATFLEAGIAPQFIYRFNFSTTFFSFHLSDAEERLDGGPDTEGGLADDIARGAVVVPGTGRRDRATLLKAAQALPDLKFFILDPEASSEWDELEKTKLTNLPNVNWGLDYLPLEKYIALIKHAKLVLVAIRSGQGDGGHSTMSLAHRVGTPVIFSNVPGISDYVKHGHDAYLIPAADPDAMAVAIMQLWEDPEMRGELSKNGRATEAARMDASKQGFLLALSNAVAGLP